ncbi:MAG: hypothetical protein NTZ90_05900 [Proteobacteria bacterium]|nr:hypothetical protein [Pseudomonadota bacterium]
MNPWENDPAYADFRVLAQKLEAALSASNRLLISLASLTPEAVLPAFKAAQGQILGFDEHAMERFAVALEEKRVVTLSQNNIFMTCILSSAVALSEFKIQPQKADGGFLAKSLNKLRQHSTTSLSLGALAWASFYTVMGKGLLVHAKQRRGRQKVIRAR